VYGAGKPNVTVDEIKQALMKMKTQQAQGLLP